MWYREGGAVHLTARKQREEKMSETDVLQGLPPNCSLVCGLSFLWSSDLSPAPSAGDQTFNHATLWEHFVSKRFICHPCLAFLSILKLGISKVSWTHAASAFKYFPSCQFLYTWLWRGPARTEDVSWRRKSQVGEALLNILSYHFIYLLLMNWTSSFQNLKASEDYMRKF